MGIRQVMKLLVPLIVVSAVVCIVLFVAGVISPARSRRWQSFTGGWFRKAERKGDESGGRVGDMTREALGLTRRATEASARRGRDLHAKLPSRAEERDSPSPEDEQPTAPE